MELNFIVDFMQNLNYHHFSADPIHRFSKNSIIHARKNIYQAGIEFFT